MAVLAVFLIVPQFPKLWFSGVWPITLLVLAIADLIAIGLATKAALSVNRLWWWSVGGGVVCMYPPFRLCCRLMHVAGCPHLAFEMWVYVYDADGDGPYKRGSILGKRINQARKPDDNQIDLPGKRVFE